MNHLSEVINNIIKDCPDVIIALQMFDWKLLRYPYLDLTKATVEIYLDYFDQNGWIIRYKRKNYNNIGIGFFSIEEMKKIIELAKSEKFKLLLNFI